MRLLNPFIFSYCSENSTNELEHLHFWILINYKRFYVFLQLQVRDDAIHFWEYWHADTNGPCFRRSASHVAKFLGEQHFKGTYVGFWVWGILCSEALIYNINYFVFPVLISGLEFFFYIFFSNVIKLFFYELN